MLTDILGAFSENIRSKVEGGFLKADWVIDGTWNSGRWLHGAIWGALAAAAPENTMVLVEPSLSGIFKPDLVFINSKHEKLVVIEYESSNSSDERLIMKDLAHYKQTIIGYAGAENFPGKPDWVLPKLWLIISTLPSEEVKNWPWHGYNGSYSEGYGPAEKNQAARNDNPLKYYEQSLHKAFADHWREIRKEMPDIERQGVQLVWANIDQNCIRVMNINGQSQEDGATFDLFGNPSR